MLQTSFVDAEINLNLDGPKEGIAVASKTQGTTAQIEGVKFKKGVYSFSGSKIDRQFSYSKIDFALRQNSRPERQQSPNIKPQLKKK